VADSFSWLRASTHPDRRVNGGELTDAELLGRMPAYVNG
jgi:hypothetical protein